MRLRVLTDEQEGQAEHDGTPHVIEVVNWVHSLHPRCVLEEWDPATGAWVLVPLVYG